MRIAYASLILLRISYVNWGHHMQPKQLKCFDGSHQCFNKELFEISIDLIIFDPMFLSIGGNGAAVSVSGFFDFAR